MWKNASWFESRRNNFDWWRNPWKLKSSGRIIFIETILIFFRSQSIVFNTIFSLIQSNILKLAKNTMEQLLTLQLSIRLVYTSMILWRKPLLILVKINFDTRISNKYGVISMQIAFLLCTNSMRRSFYGGVCDISRQSSSRIDSSV